MDDISTALNNFLNGSRHFGTNEGVARYILQHMTKIPDMKLAELAEQCHTSTTSIIRFCHDMGFQDYTDLKKEISCEISFKSERTDWVGKLGDGMKLEAIQHWTSCLARYEAETMLAIDWTKMEQLARDILNYQYVYLFGSNLSSMFGEYLRVLLSFQNKLVINMTEPEYDVGLSPSKKDTLVLVISQHNRYLAKKQKLFPYLKNNADKIWLLTQQTHSDDYQRQASDVLHILGNDQASFEYHAMLCIAEWIGRYCCELLEQDKK